MRHVLAPGCVDELGNRIVQRQRFDVGEAHGEAEGRQQVIVDPLFAEWIAALA